MNTAPLELFLLRHGKSNWDADFASDHDRPLARRGERDADNLGYLLAQVDRVPELVLTSSAIRARTTVERAVEAGGWPSQVTVLRPLYGASPSEVLDTIWHHAQGTRRVMVAGHEPTTSELVSALIGGGSIRVPTAGLAALRPVVSDWRDLHPGLATLEWLIIPKLIKDLRPPHER